MNAAAPVSRARDSHLALLVVLSALALALAWFASQKLHYLTDYSLASYSDNFWPRRAGLIPHLAGGAVRDNSRAGADLARTHESCQPAASRAGQGLRGGRADRQRGRLLPGAHNSRSLTLQPAPACSCSAWHGLLTTAMALYAILTRRIEQQP